MPYKTTDLCDQYGDQVHVAEPVFRSYGARRAFHGPVQTVRVHEDNVLVRAQLAERGEGRVLVVDGGASMHCALLGDNLAALAAANGWAGVIVNGCIRDAADIARIELGVLALHTHPRKSRKEGHGEVGLPVRFAGIGLRPDAWVYVDEDGLVVAEQALQTGRTYA